MMQILKEILKKIILVFLSFKVLLVSFKLNKKNKNLFIDLGTNKGQGFKYFIKFFSLETFDYILVEPNPNLKEVIKKIIYNSNYPTKIKFINKAAYIKNSNSFLFGTVEDQRGLKSDGASILKEHNSKMYESSLDGAVKVETFDLIEELKKLKDYNNIIIKMDIEGSEYDVLEKLIRHSSEIQNIKHIFVEFHSRFLSKEYKDIYVKREKKIKKDMNSINLKFTNWI